MISYSPNSTINDNNNLDTHKLAQAWLKQETATLRGKTAHLQQCLYDPGRRPLLQQTGFVQLSRYFPQH